MQKDKSLCLIAFQVLSTKYHFWLMHNEEVLLGCRFVTDKVVFSMGSLTTEINKFPCNRSAGLMH